VLYGFLAIEADGNTVSGLTFYEHAETPGLGGEVDNPRWKALWPGKQIVDSNGDVALTVVKGKVIGESDYEIDGLSGATLTSKGVANLIEYWMGDKAFGSYLSKVRSGEV
jgi:Na+-transporting NADH:ubiquinone oxidoreductase subunit C